MQESNMIVPTATKYPESNWPLSGIKIDDWDNVIKSKTPALMEDSGSYIFNTTKTENIVISGPGTIDPNMENRWRLDIEFEITKVLIATGDLNLVGRGLGGGVITNVIVTRDKYISVSGPGFLAVLSTRAIGLNERIRFSFIRDFKRFICTIDDEVLLDREYPNAPNRANTSDWMFGTNSNTSGQPWYSNASMNWILYGFEIHRY